MRLLICLLSILMCVTACNDRELHVHEKEYEWLQEIEAKKRKELKITMANLAVQYAHKAGDPGDIAAMVVDACSTEINRVVEAAGEVKSGERGGGLKRESEVDKFKKTTEANLRKKLWKEVTKIIENERAKKAKKAKKAEKTTKDKKPQE